MRCPKCKRKATKVHDCVVCLNPKCEILIIKDDTNENITKNISNN